MTFVVIIHILAAIFLVGLVLIQDSKGGGVLGVGGSNSVFGATGAQTLAAKLTQIMALVFAITSIYLSINATKSTSVVDAVTTDIPAATQPATPETTTAAPAATNTAEKATEPTPAQTAPATTEAPKK